MEDVRLAALGKKGGTESTDEFWMVRFIKRMTQSLGKNTKNSGIVSNPTAYGNLIFEGKPFCKCDNTVND